MQRHLVSYSVLTKIVQEKYLMSVDVGIKGYMF